MKNGAAVVVKTNAGIKVAFYCDEAFFTLEYDPTLGVLRKVYIEDPILEWTEIRM